MNKKIVIAIIIIILLATAFVFVKMWQVKNTKQTAVDNGESVVSQQSENEDISTDVLDNGAQDIEDELNSISDDEFSEEDLSDDELGI